ncbi:STAS domain-containing protein [Streptomyces atroolivaceus]|uniref:STAS domain-containing protein n=1 Tax=Streptomyces atroolivaceus TaxID=66869 RepID=UPI00202550A6|nr:STAS domain-containing protein [Streptomyces atroolivaceus]
MGALLLPSASRVGSVGQQPGEHLLLAEVFKRCFQQAAAGSVGVVEEYAVEGGWVVVGGGDFDWNTVLRLRQALEAAAATQPLVILDAGAVTFADSTTLSLLLRTHQSTHFRIVAPPPALLPDAEGHRHRPGPGDPADRGSGTHFLTPNRGAVA